jgi:hypothetical protein
VNAARAAYRPLAMVVGAAAGLAAGAVFERGWRALSGSENVPRAIDEDRGWGEILAAAALHGAVFAVVRAAAERVSAAGVRRVTGTWPA